MNLRSLALPCFLLFACAGKVTTDYSVNGNAETADAAVSDSGGSSDAAVPGTVNAFAQDDLYVYLAASNGSLGQVSGIYRLPKNGANGAQLITTTSVFVDGIAVDEVNIYWTDLCGTDPNCDGGAILSMPKGGGAVTTLASGQMRPWDIAVDEANVYWTNQGQDETGEPFGGGQVVSLPKTGGSAPLVLVDGLELAEQIVLDSDGVIFSDLTSIHRVPKGGGAVTTLENDAPGGPSATNIVVAGGQLYYCVGAWSNPPSACALTTVATSADDDAGPSNSPFGTVLASVPAQTIAANATMLFWNGAQGEVWAMNLAGGSSSVLAPPEPSTAGTVVDFMVGLLVDAHAVYSLEYIASYAGGAQTLVRVLPLQ